MRTRTTLPAMLAIGDLAQRTGVAASALRFYEERGLIASERNAAGHRRYPRHTTRRVAFIVFAQRIGLSLSEIRTELDQLPEGRIPAQDDWALLTGKWQARIDARIRELERLREGLTTCIGCGCLSLDHCQVMNPGDIAGSHGPGPRYWEGDERPFADADQPTRHR